MGTSATGNRMNMDDLRMGSCHSRTIATRAKASRPMVLVNHLVEPPGRITGITRYAFGLIEALARRGVIRIALATSFTADDLPTGISSRIDALFTLPHVASTPLNYFRQQGLLRKICADLRPDMLYAMNPMCPGVAGVPSAITVHDLYMEVLPELYARRHRLWWTLFFAAAARRADRIFCVSGNTAGDIVRRRPHLKGKISLVPGAGVLPHFEEESGAAERTDASPYFLLLGNVTPNKNLGFLSAALKRIAATGPKVRVVHVGRDLCGDLAQAVATSDGQLESFGGVDDCKLDKLMRHAQALIQPSRYEGFGLPIIEAHERGLPVIASDIEVFREVGGDGCTYVALDDAGALAEAMRTALVEPGWRRVMSDLSRTNALRYSWDQSAAAAEAVILGCVERRHLIAG